MATSVHLLIPLLACACMPVVSANGDPLKLGFLIPWTDEWELGPFMGSAALLGIQTAQELGLLGGRSVIWEWTDTHCQARPGLGGAVDMWSNLDGLDAFIGGGCSVVCEPVALLAAAFNLPYVSFGCSSDTLSNTYNYPTFSRSVGTWVSLAPMFQKAVSHYGWDRVAVITTTQNIMQLTANEIKVRTSHMHPYSYGETMIINLNHYNDVIMSVMASQIAGVSIVYSTVCSDADQRKNPRHWPLWGEITGHRWFPRTKGQ